MLYSIPCHTTTSYIVPVYIPYHTIPHYTTSYIYYTTPYHTIRHHSRLYHSIVYKLLILLPTNYVTIKTVFLLLISSEAVSAFAWEPQGDAFAIIHGESPKISVSFYRCQKGGHTNILSKSIHIVSSYMVG